MSSESLEIGETENRQFSIAPEFFLWENSMVRLEGLEPPTTWFEAKYSIQLSYRRVEGEWKMGSSK